MKYIKNFIDFFKIKDTGNLRIIQEVEDGNTYFVLEKEIKIGFIKFWPMIRYFGFEYDAILQADEWLKDFNNVEKFKKVKVWDSSKRTALLNIKNQMYEKISAKILKESFDD